VAGGVAVVVGEMEKHEAVSGERSAGKNGRRRALVLVPLTAHR
jgi:hypothetical protein